MPLFKKKKKQHQQQQNAVHSDTPPAVPERIIVPEIIIGPSPSSDDNSGYREAVIPSESDSARSDPISQSRDVPEAVNKIDLRFRLPAYLYPIEGIIYLLTHWQLFRVIGPRVLPCLLLSLGVILFMFFFLYVPHVALLSFYLGPAAFVQAALMILNESAVLISVLCENFLLEESLVRMFDAVLLLENLQPLVESGQEVDPTAPNVVAKLGKFKKSPNLRASCKVITEFIFFMPLNFLPLVGPIIFLMIQGNRAGPIAHFWYYRLKGWDKKKKDTFVQDHHWQYIWFGTVSLALQIIPVLSIIISFSNAIGAALWAAYLEKSSSLAPAFTGMSPSMEETDPLLP